MEYRFWKVEFVFRTIKQGVYSVIGFRAMSEISLGLSRRKCWQTAAGGSAGCGEPPVLADETN